jgi:RimJ/RimL family protein N-acetyltransferase
MALKLETTNCRIRDWARSDKAAVLRHANNRKVWRNLTHRFPHPYAEADADWWFGFLERMPEPTHWAIEVQGEAVGGIGVMVGEGVFAKSGHFGYWLGEEYWGRGIMTQAVAVVAPYAMSRFGLVRLEAPVFAWNPASMRVLEKCGFSKEGVLTASVFKDGELVDQVLYARVEPRR